MAIADLAGATLNLNGFAQTVAGLSGGGTNGGVVTLGAGTLTINPGRRCRYEFDGTITGTGGLTRNGAGTLVLSGTNSYSGATTILAGTLQLGAGGTTGSVGAGAIANSGLLAINRSDAVTLTNAISGTGGLRQAGRDDDADGHEHLHRPDHDRGGPLQIGNGGTTGALARRARSSTTAR